MSCSRPRLPSARISRFNLAPAGQADLVDGIWVSGDYFSGLGVPPILGRTFTSEDDQRGGGANGPVSVISYGLWQRRFGSATDVVGRSVTIDRVPFAIVGVMPVGFFGSDVGTRFDIAIPLGTESLMRGRDSYLDRPTTSWLAIMARLKDRQQPSQAQSALLALLAAHPRRHGATGTSSGESSALSGGAAHGRIDRHRHVEHDDSRGGRETIPLVFLQ